MLKHAQILVMLHKVKYRKDPIGLIELYNDFVDTALVLKAMRDSDPAKALPLDAYLSRKKKRAYV